MAERICRLVAEQCQKSAHAVRDFEARIKDCESQSNDRTSGVKVELFGHTVSMQCQGNRYDLHRRHFEKVRRLYEKHCDDDPQMACFKTRVFCLCVRYHFYLNSRNQGEFREKMHLGHLPVKNPWSFCPLRPDTTHKFVHSQERVRKPCFDGWKKTWASRTNVLRPRGIARWTNTIRRTQTSNGGSDLPDASSRSLIRSRAPSRPTLPFANFR